MTNPRTFIGQSQFHPSSNSEGFHAPFRFTAEGEIVLSPDLSPRQGVRIFIHRYVREWVLWHRSGCDHLTVCDRAAFVTAAIHSYYFDQAPWQETRDWLSTVFGIPAAIDFLAPGPKPYSEQTLQVLRNLRPTTWTLPVSEKADESHDWAAFQDLLSLALPVEHLLVLGGDNRLTLDPKTLLNGYGCRPFPRPEAITFSSSTATSISKYAFDIAEQRRQLLIVDAIREGVSPAAEKLADEVRHEIYEELCAEPGMAEIALSSSGTDCFLIAQVLIRLVSEVPLVSVMVGADESGTGVPLAARERHFALKAALGDMVEKGERLDGTSDQDGFIEIALRDAQNRTVPPELLDQQVCQVIEDTLAKGVRVVVHAMNHSKLGRAGPSMGFLLELKQRFGDRVNVIVDACQMRLDLDELRQYLKQGFPVIITGSKFFTGPPLSGAVLIPQEIVSRVLSTARTLPESFNAYCARYDLPPTLRQVLVNPGSNFNLGSYFRWVAAVAEMKRYYRIPAKPRKEGLEYFCRKVEERLQAQSCIELAYEIPSPHVEGNRATGELSGRRMIFPYYLLRDQTNRQICSEAEVRKIYILLNQDCSDRFEAANAREYRLLAQKCHIGQPVKAPHPSGQIGSLLRLNVGARVISESWSESSRRIEPELISDELWQVGVVLDKIDLLLRKLSASGFHDQSPA